MCFVLFLFNFDDTEQLGKETAYELTANDRRFHLATCAHVRLLPYTTVAMGIGDLI